jgi:hypothetical protein
MESHQPLRGLQPRAIILCHPSIAILQVDGSIVKLGFMLAQMDRL